VDDRTSIVILVLMLFVTACAGSTDTNLKQTVCLGFCATTEAKQTTTTEVIEND